MKKLLTLLNSHELLRFIIVGSTACAINYAVYAFFVALFDFNPNIAYVLGFLVSVSFNFIASSYFTFKTAPTLPRALKFLSSHTFNILLEIGLLNLYIAMGIEKMYTPIFIYPVAFPINFILVRLSLKGRKNKKIKI